MKRRLTGAAAVLLIGTILIGIPLLLSLVGPDPITGISWQRLTSGLLAPDDGTLLISLIKIVAWVAWAILALALLLEIIARLRGLHAPHIPGLSLPQHLARDIVAAAAMLFIAVPAVAAPALAAPTPTPTPAHTISAPATPHTATPARPHNTGSTPTPAPAKPATTVSYTVKPGDSLWSIAQRHLGDPHRYTEIAHLNSKLLGGQANFLTPGWTLQLPADATASSASTSTAHTVTVQAGDTLSDIALEQLGDAKAWPAIAHASSNITQPDGQHLTNPNLIQPGWKVTIPRTAAAAQPQTNTKPSTPATNAHPGNAPTAPPATKTPATSAPATAPATAPSGGQAAPQTSAAEAPTDQHATQQASSTHVASDDDSDWIVRTAEGVGAILAVGVIALIARRRRTQQSHRRPGQTIPMPTGAAAATEQALRATGNPLTVEMVDQALRALAQDCAAQGLPLPEVRAGRLTATQFDLYLAEPAHLPTPWTGTADTTVWSLLTSDVPSRVPGARNDTPAPWPALVTIGHDDEDGHVLLNLEHLGALGLTGADTTARGVMAALAVELATSAWADDLQVTIVGAYPELEDTLQTGRIRYLPTAGRLLDPLTDRAAHDRTALQGVPNLPTARATGEAPTTWTPEIVLVAGDLTSTQREQLEQLIDQIPRVAIACVTTNTTVGEWTLDLDAGDDAEHAILEPIGLRIRPQQVPADQYAALLALASAADPDASLETPQEAVDEPTLTQVDAIPAPTLSHVPSAPVSQMPEVSLAMLNQPVTLDGTPTVAFTGVLLPTSERPDSDQDDHTEGVPSSEPPTTPAPTAAPSDEPKDIDESKPAGPIVQVLGRPAMIGAEGPVEPTKRGRLVELVAYLALNPGATHHQIDDAIWPDRRNQDNLNTRNTATSKLRRWLGTDPQGADYLPRFDGDGYRLSGVGSDLSQWRQLLGPRPLTSTTEHLEEALRLVRGVPFEGVHPSRYAWAEPLRQQLISEIVDVSYELGRRRLMEGRWLAAEQAVVVGLRLDPVNETLWRLRILAAHSSRNAEAQAEAINRFLAITEQLEADIEPETRELLDGLTHPNPDVDLMAIV